MEKWLCHNGKLGTESDHFCFIMMVKLPYPSIMEPRAAKMEGVMRGGGIENEEFSLPFCPCVIYLWAI